MGLSSITGDESIYFCDNISFNGTPRSGKLTTDLEIWVGSTVAPHVQKRLLTSSDSSISFSLSPGVIDVKSSSAFDPTKEMSYYDDCINQVQWDIRNDGANSGAGYFPPEIHHPGMFAVTTGIDVAGKASLLYSTLGSNNPQFLLSTDTFSYQTCIKIDTLPSVTDDYAFIVGVSDYWIFGAGNGMSFKVDGSANPTWAIETANGGSFTISYSAETITTGWHTLKMIGNSTSVEFFVDSVSIGTATINLPTHPINVNSVSIFKSAGNTAVFCYQDYFLFNTNLSR